MDETTPQSKNIKPIYKSKTALTNLIIIGLLVYSRKSGIEIIDPQYSAEIVAAANILLRRITSDSTKWF